MSDQMNSSSSPQHAGLSLFEDWEMGAEVLESASETSAYNARCADEASERRLYEREAADLQRVADQMRLVRDEQMSAKRDVLERIMAAIKEHDFAPVDSLNAVSELVADELTHLEHTEADEALQTDAEYDERDGHA